MILEFFRTLMIIVLLVFTIWTIFVIIKTIFSFWKSRRLFKSSFNSTWKTFLSSIMVIFLFGISFSIIGGTVATITVLDESVNNLVIDNHMHMGYASLDDIDKKSTFETKPLFIDNKINDFNYETINDNTKDVYEYLYYYFDENPVVLYYFWFLALNKIVSSVTIDDTFDNINWKYELSYYMSNSSVNWAYQYISLNDHNILKMIYDVSTKNIHELSYYENDIYNKAGLMQLSFEDDFNNHLLINDYEIEKGETKESIDKLIKYDTNKDYDYEVGVGADWARKNNYHPGEIISLPQPFGMDFKAKIAFTFRAPQYMYPSFSPTKAIPNTENQTYILMNSRDFLNLFKGVAKSKIYFGWNNLYNDINTYTDYSSNYFKTQMKKYITTINGLSFQLFDNARIFLFNDVSVYDSLSTEVIFFQIFLMKIVSFVLLMVFLLITLGILIVLIKKKIENNKPELGTLKAIGWDYKKISLSFISFSLMIILIGGILALLFGFLIQNFWLGFLGKRFLIKFKSPTITLMQLLIVFILPIALLISISYLLTKKVLKKPTIELLKNVDYNKPNFLVKAFDKMKFRPKNFYLSYQIKMIFRGVGKSMILFVSILFSFIFVSMSITGVNLVNNSVVNLMDSVNVDNVFLIDNYKDTEFINSSNVDINEKYINYYMFTDKITYKEIKDLSTFEEVYNLAKTKINLSGTTSLELAQSMDIELGNYISTTPFYKENSIIPWQSFAILKYALDEVNKGTSKDPSWKEIPLEKTGISFNSYTNIFNQYINYYNLNKEMRTSDSEEIIKPNITINSFIYDGDSLYPLINGIMQWDTYIDNYSGEKIQSLWELGFHKKNTNLINQRIGIFDGERWIIKDSSKWKTEKEWLEEQKKYDDSLSKESGEKYLLSEYILTSEGEWKVDEKTKIKYQDNVYSPRERNTKAKSKDFNYQWFSSFENTKQIKNTINLKDKDYQQKLNDYKTHEVSTTYIDKTSGEISHDYATTIPIIIDQANAKRLGAKEGDIITTNNIDGDDEKLFNNLIVDKILNNDVAFEVIDIYDSFIPMGGFTLDKFLENYENNFIPNLFLGENKQQTNYSFTSDFFQNGSELTTEFKNGIKQSISSTISKTVITDQIKIITDSINGLLFVFSFFALLISISLILISIKEIADNSINEISILKANGVTSSKATRIILMPYIFIMMIALLIAIPINLIVFFFASKGLSKIVGIFQIKLGLFLWQWIVLFVLIFAIFMIIYFIVFFTIKRKSTVSGLN